MFACNLFPYDRNPIVDDLLRNVFGAWLTSRNVVQSVMKSAGFSSWSVTTERNPGEQSKQIHVFAQAL